MPSLRLVLIAEGCVWSTESRQVNCPPVVALTGTVHPIPRSEADQEIGAAISTDECSQRRAHVEKNEDGPLARSHRLTRGPHFSVGSCQPPSLSQCIGLEPVLEGERLTSSVVLYSGNTLGTTRAIVARTQPMPVQVSVR
jgi:hypothetical protein